MRRGHLALVIIFSGLTTSVAAFLVGTYSYTPDKVKHALWAPSLAFASSLEEPCASDESTSTSCSAVPKQSTVGLFFASFFLFYLIVGAAAAAVVVGLRRLLKASST